MLVIPSAIDSAKPIILISGCIVGHKVRYNGESKDDDWVCDVLGKICQFVTVCPEMAMGLGKPREAMRLVRDKGSDAIRLIGSRSKRDFTALAEEHQTRLANELSSQIIDGMILMGRSPSCGLERVKIYQNDQIPINEGTGVFAGKIRQQFPYTPAIEVGRFSDKIQRNHFLVHLYAAFRLRTTVRSKKALQEFHRRYKYLFMAYSPHHLKQLGSIAALAVKKMPIDEQFASYGTIMYDMLKEPLNPGRYRNALAHVYGYFKNDLHPKQKEKLLGAIDCDDKALMAQSHVPLELMAYENLAQNHSYIEEQYLFAPFPASLN